MIRLAAVICLTSVLAGCDSAQSSQLERRVAMIEQREAADLSPEEIYRASKQRVSPEITRTPDRTIHRCPNGTFVSSITVAEPSGRVSLIECRPLYEID